MTGVVLVNPRVKFTNTAGVPLALGWLTVYEAGTTTLSNTWQDKAQTTLNTNPIHLDANGECLLWVDSAKTYKLLLQDATLVTVTGWPVDNIPGAADVAAAAAAAAAAATVYVTAAQTAETNAETAQTAAELARDQAYAASRIYATGAAGVAAVASGEYFYVPSASTDLALELHKDNAGADLDTGKRVPDYTYVSDTRTLTAASAGDVYELGTAVLYGATTPNTSTYPGGFPDTFFPSATTTTRGYLQDFSIRTAGGAGTGQVVVLTPDPVSPYDFDVVAVVAVVVADGVNTFQGSTIYTDALPVGSSVGYRTVSGGTPRYAAAGNATKRISSVAQTAGTAMTGDRVDYSNHVAVAFNLRPADTDSLDERVTDLEDGTGQIGVDLSVMLGEAVTASSVTTGNTGLSITSSLPTAGWLFSLAPTTNACILESVILPTANPFSDADTTLYNGRVGIGEVNAAGAIIITHITQVKLGAGKTNTITGFGNLLLPARAFVIVQVDSVRAPLSYHTGTSGGTYASNPGGTLTLGDTVELPDYANTPIFSYTVRQAADPIGQRLDLSDLLADTSNPVALERTGFRGTSLPSGWVASGAWTVSNGLTPPASGGWGVKVLNATFSALWKHNQIARIKINSTNTITGLAQSPPESSGGAALLIDGVAGKLRLYSWDDTGAAGTLLAETALPAALTVAREYILKLDKDGLTLTGTFKDTVTQASCTVTANGAVTYTMAHGKCGPLFISATTPPVYQWLEYLAPYPRKCRALLIGDSIGEGAYLGTSSPTWMAQVSSARSAQNDIVIATRAGDETPNFFGRKAFDLDLWLPQFVVIALGTNDTNQDTWRTNVNTLIAKALALGAEPILCTQVPRTAAQAMRTAMNTDIRTNYFGRYRYIDMAIPVSSGNLGVAWSATYDFGDGVHPNAAGQNLMYTQAQIDAPFLFV